jgi:hypothetical protein
MSAPPSSCKSSTYSTRGDDGGIMCNVTVLDAKEAIVCSIPQLHVSRSHPVGLADQVMIQSDSRVVG